MKCTEILFLFLTSLLSSVKCHSHHYHHRYTSTYIEEDNNNDEELTNEDKILDVNIDPPLRLNIFETRKVLSQKAKEAVVTAMNEHATYRMQLHFRDSEFFFDKVEFELMESHTLERDVRRTRGREMRVFEREEVDMGDFDGLDEFDEGEIEAEEEEEWKEYPESGLHSDSNFNSDPDFGREGRYLRRRDERRRQREIEINIGAPSTNENMDVKERQVQQQVMYGTSFLLGGKMSFSLFPAAPDSECNSQLLSEMQRDWFMHKYILQQNNTELDKVIQWLIKTTSESQAPTPGPSSVPSQYPSIRPSFLDPSSVPSYMPSSMPSSKPSEAHSSVPSGGPSSNPSSVPTSTPSGSPTTKPSLQPSDVPSKNPSSSPSSKPSISHRPTHEFFPSTSPSSVPSLSPSDRPSPTKENPSSSSVNKGDPTMNDNDNDKSMLIPIIVASAASLVLFIASGLFAKRMRNNRSMNMSPLGKKEMGHKRLDDDDDDDEGGAYLPEHDNPFSSQMIPSLIPTREESGSTDSDEAPDYFSEPSGIASSSKGTAASQSISSCQTMKVNNVGGGRDGNANAGGDAEEMEKKWAKSPLKNTSLVKGSMRPPMAPSSAQKSFPLKLEDCADDRVTIEDGMSKITTDDEPSGSDKGANGNCADEDSSSPKNISLQVVGAASGAVTAGSTVGPSLMKFFVRGDGSEKKTHSRSSSLQSTGSRKGSSPITAISPSKVSKEEFEKGWDMNLPYAWDPRRDQKKSSDSQLDQNDIDIENAFNAFNDADGSFPTFDENDSLVEPIRTRKPMSVSSRRSSPFGTRSIGESTAYQSANEMHPLDWSNKGSEYDGTSIGESTYTDGENTATREMNHVSWDQVNIEATGQRTPLGINLSELNSTNYLTPAMSGIRTPKSASSEPSRQSVYTASSNACSSPSSKGSSKQLINDLVWLEKKIADVRKRVDKLDEDDGYSSASSPMSPDTLNQSVGSPISHNIVCRDVIAPPGKLNIVIHSTKDGPAIHSVKPGSALEGKLFQGDLVVAVDDTDTRTFNAVDVMEMMTQRSDSERKITIIHMD